MPFSFFRMSAETPSQEEAVSSDAMAKIRLSLLAALQETERIEECLQGISNASVTDRLQSLVKHLSVIDENANNLDADHSSIPANVLTSLASQSSESVEIIARVKAEIDNVASRGKAQVAPVASLREKIAQYLVDPDIAVKFKESVSRRGLMPPAFVK